MKDYGRLALAIAASLIAIVPVELIAAESAEQVKTRIFREIDQQDQLVKSETEKLEQLYKERGRLNPDLRLQEMEDAGIKLASDAMKAALEQAKDVKIDTPDKAWSAAKRAKDGVKNFKQAVEARDAVTDDMERQETIETDISFQEKKVQKAKYDLGVMKGAASVAIPLLNAMAGAPPSIVRPLAPANKNAGRAMYPLDRPSDRPLHSPSAERLTGPEPLDGGASHYATPSGVPRREPTVGSAPNNEGASNPTPPSNSMPNSERANAKPLAPKPSRASPPSPAPAPQRGPTLVPGPS